MELDSCCIRKVNQEETKKRVPVNRMKTCPFLLRAFVSNGGHNNLEEYRQSFPKDELQIYTWKDATLLELTKLIEEVKPDYRRQGITFEFALVFPNGMSFGHRYRNIGTTCVGKEGQDDNKTLSQLGFHVGDFVDVAVITPVFYNPHFQRQNPHFQGHNQRPTHYDRFPSKGA